MSKFDEAYAETLKFADEMTGKYGVLETASVMSAIALVIYKTVLPADDFNSLMDTISESRDQVKKLDVQRNLH